LPEPSGATAAEEHEIRVLDAEWAYLTRPETLEGMNRQFLSLAPISTKQLHTTAADIPLRPVPSAPPPAAAPAEATTVVAAVEPTPPSSAVASAIGGGAVAEPGPDCGQSCGRTTDGTKRATRDAGIAGKAGLERCSSPRRGQ